MSDPKLAETPDEIAAQIMKSYLDREYLYSHGARRNMLISDISAALKQKDGRIRDLEQANKELLEALRNKLEDCLLNGDCSDAALMPGEYCSDGCSALAAALSKHGGTR